MGIFTVSDERHRQLQRVRRNTWNAIALCAALRLVDTAFGFGLVEPTQTLAAQDIPTCVVANELYSNLN
jgi:hypothetical protein